MKKVLVFMLVICLGLSLIACGTPSAESQESYEPVVETTKLETQEATGEEITEQESTIPETESILEYFESDAIVNDFFVSYNAIALNTIDAALIEKGNISTKALVYADSFSLEVINTNNGMLSISVETKPEEEYTIMFAVFSDCIKAISALSNDEIASAWDTIHETGYMVEDFDLSGILITYVPSKELSWGINKPRVDLTIPIE